MQRRTSILMAAVGALALSAFGLDHVVEQSQIKRVASRLMRSMRPRRWTAGLAPSESTGRRTCLRRVMAPDYTPSQARLLHLCLSAAAHRLGSDS